MIAVAAAFFSPPVVAADGGRPVVVELFTSQGCNSCPPADALLGELAARPDVLPLSFHVTYWDRLGWPDTFGLEANVERQSAHAKALGARGLYTPQMVLDGRLDVVGAYRNRVLQAIELLQANAEPGPTLAVTGDRLEIGLSPEPDDAPATVWLVGFDHAHDVVIERGENRGHTLRYHNVVRGLTRLGSWTGEPVQLALPQAQLAGRDEGAILVQRESRRHGDRRAPHPTDAALTGQEPSRATTRVSSPKKHWKSITQ